MSKRILIVGQGIAGTCLAWEARRYGLDFTIIDSGSAQSASAASSGIMNPITGRNFVKSWMTDDFMQVGIETYEAMSLKYKQQLIHAAPMIRHIATIESQNVWDSKVIQEGYSAHMSNGPAIEDYKDILSDLHALGTVVSCHRVDVLTLLQLNRKQWIEEGFLVECTFLEEDLEIRKNNVIFRDAVYDAIVFARGWKGGKSSLWDTDTYRPAKGEVLLVRIPNMSSDYIIKYSKFIVPQGGDLFWVGTTWQWEFDDEGSEEDKSAELTTFLNSFLKLEYQILSRKAGVRPATKYRRPLIGSHKKHPHLFLCNGLGTKGVTMAPYWSRKIIEYISTNNLTESVSFTEAFHHAFLSQKKSRSNN